jgi:WD40 repeat protein
VSDADTGEVKFQFGNQKGAHGVAFSPTGRHIVSGSYDKTVKVWDAANGRELLTFNRHTSAVHCVTFSRDGKRIASGSGTWSNLNQSPGELRVFDTESGEQRLHIENPRGTVMCVSFSPDGRRIAAGTTDKLLKVWDIETAEVVVECEGNTGFVGFVLFSQDGKRFVSSGGGGVRVWDAQNGRELLILKDVFGPLAFSNDGQRLVTGGPRGSLVIWDAPKSNS